MNHLIKQILITIVSLLSIYLSRNGFSFINQGLNDQTPRPTQGVNFREEVKLIEQNKYFPLDEGINIVILAMSILLFFIILLRINTNNISKNIILLFYILALFFIVGDTITPAIDFERGILPSTGDTIFIPIFHSLLINTILFSTLYWGLIRRVKNLGPQTNMIILILYTIFFGVALRYSSSHLASIITGGGIWGPMYFNYPKRILLILISILGIYYSTIIAYNKIEYKT